MVSLTKKERETLLILFKDYTAFYNANSISKVLGISHVGAQKIFKRLLNEQLIIDRRIGKSIVYKPKLEDDYVRKLISFLLADEANNFRRWKEEFKKLFKKDRIIMMYGSAIKNYKQAEDIDIMLVIKKGEFKEVTKTVSGIQETLPKKIHLIKLTTGDLLKNTKNKKQAIIDIVRNAVILCGQDKYVWAIKNVTGF